MTTASNETGAHGLTARRDNVVIDVAFVAPGIVRIMAADDGASASPASWAVLPAFRDPAPANAAHTDAHAVLSDDLLAVAIDRTTLAIVVADRDGTILCADHPRDPLRFDAPGWRARKHAPAGERYYGLGDKPGPLEKRGHAYEMWNTDAYGFQESWDPLYKTIPFVLAVRDGLAWGLFVDTTHRSAFDLCVTARDAIGFSASGGPLRYYVIAGPTPKDVLTRYTSLVGRIALPPLWSLGYGQCRYSYETQAEAEEVVRTHREKAIPLDALWLDIGFQDRNRPFTVDETAYPDLAGMVARFADQGVHTVAITDLHIPHLPGEDFAPYETGASGDHFVKDAGGEVFVGKVWPGDCVFPDFTREATRDWWGTLYRDFHLERGIAGFWNDMNEPAVFEGPGHTMPEDVRHRIEEPGFETRLALHAEIHNVYGMQNARATHDGLLALAPDRRPFVLTRASYAGGQRHAATWTGDNSSTENHMRLSTPHLLSLGLSGFALSGCDIGGFKGNPSPDLLTRWIALGAFNPLFRNHTDKYTKNQEIWVHGPEHEALRRAAIERRYRLMAYLYTAVEEAARTGIPVMRPMFLEFADPILAREDRNFMFGPALLVAPPPEDQADQRRLHLPQAANWYDLDTGAALHAATDEAAGPETRGTIAIDRAPLLVTVLVKGGTILPVQQGGPHTGTRATETLALHIYPDREGRAAGTLYADDGASFAYREGGFFRQHYAYDGAALTVSAPEGSFPLPFAGLELVLHAGNGTPTKRAAIAAGGPGRFAT